MPSLFENAIASIRMGVEDLRQQDADRDMSSVRNFYAGVLLLAKEAIIRQAPNADPSLVIGAKMKPIPDGNGGIEMEQVGHTTVDFQQITERAKSFGVALDHKALKELNSIRNDIEHHYTSESSTAIRAAVSKGFPIVASLCRQMDEDPIMLLGETWTTMLETKEMYDKELLEAKQTLARIAWYSASVSQAQLNCSECQSELLEQTDPQNESQDLIEFRCKTCGANPELADVIEATVEKLYGADAYVRYKDAFEEGPIYDCPACQRTCLIEGEDGCANCSEPLDYEDECKFCGNGISIQDFLDGLDDGQCSYCSYRMEKLMKE